MCEDYPCCGHQNGDCSDYDGSLFGWQKEGDN